MRSLRLLPLLAVLAACSDSTGPAGAVRITATADAAAPPGSDNVTFSVENRSGRTVQMLLCSDTEVTLVVERRVAGRWQDYAGDPCFAMYQPVDLAPGATRTETRAVREAGEYRLELRVWYRDNPEGQRIAYSDAFEVR